MLDNVMGRYREEWDCLGVARNKVIYDVNTSYLPIL